MISIIINKMKQRDDKVWHSKIFYFLKNVRFDVAEITGTLNEFIKKKLD